MKTNDRIAKATVSLFEAVDCASVFNLSEARQIFASDRKNRLNVATAMPSSIFTSIYQKFDTRIIHLINRVQPSMWDT